MSNARRNRRSSAKAGQPKGHSKSYSAPNNASIKSPNLPALSIRTIISGPAVLIAFGLMAVNLFIYAEVRNHEFVIWDDPDYVYKNVQVLNGLTLQGIRWAFTSGHAANWFPVTWLSHMLDVEMFGPHPRPHHLMNLLLHILNTLLLFWLLNWMTAAIGRSAFVAGLFAVHPLHVESVAWVAERKDVLSTLFWILTIWAYGWYAQKPGMRRYLVVALLFTTGLMSKPMLVTLPAVLLLLDFWPLQRVTLQGSEQKMWWASLREQKIVIWRLIKEKLPLLSLSIFSSIITVIVQRQAGAVGGLDTLPVGLRVGNALVSYMDYIGKMLWPANLAALYPYPHVISVSSIAGAVLFLIAVSAAALFALPRRPYLAVGWFWYLGTLVPVIGLVQVGDQAIADRYTYIPLIGLFLLIAWGATDLLVGWPARKWVLASAALPVLLAFAFLSRIQVGYWKNTTALWEHTLAITTQNYRAESNMGIILMEQGRSEEAMAHFREALRINPEFADAHNNLGILLAEKGQVSEAIAHYHQALRTKPNNIDARNNLASALADQGKIDEAIHEFLEALRIRPDADVEYNVGAMYSLKGNSSEARNHYEAALKLDPSHPQARRALEKLTGTNQGSP